jgi:hypothetical protein
MSEVPFSALCPPACYSCWQLFLSLQAPTSARLHTTTPRRTTTTTTTTFTFRAISPYSKTTTTITTTTIQAKEQCPLTTKIPWDRPSGSGCSSRLDERLHTAHLTRDPSGTGGPTWLVRTTNKSLTAKDRLRHRLWPPSPPTTPHTYTTIRANPSQIQARSTSALITSGRVSRPPTS